MNKLLIAFMLLASIKSNGQIKYKLVNCRDTLFSRFEKGYTSIAVDAGYHPNDRINYYTHYRMVVCDTIPVKSNGQTAIDTTLRWPIGLRSSVPYGLYIESGSSGPYRMYTESRTPCKTDTVPCIMMVSDTTLRGNAQVYSIRGYMTVQRGTCFTYNYGNYTPEYFDKQRLPLTLFVWMAKQTNP